jgi:hypothetical protein
MIDSVPNLAFPRRPWHWVAAVLVAELLWFCFLYPLVPTTAGAAVFEAFLPLPLLGYIYLSVLCLEWISERNWSRWTTRLLSAAIALSAGAAGVWLVDWAVINIPVEFKYHLIHSL